MQKNVFVIAVTVVLFSLLGCNPFNTTDEETLDPLVYAYEIKASVLERIYLEKDDVELINVLITDGDLLIVHFEIPGILDKISNTDTADDAVMEEKIKNAKEVLTKMQSFTDIEDVRKYCFTRYYYTISGYERNLMYFTSSYERKFENLITIGDMAKIKEGNTEIIAWLTNQQKESSYINSHKIDYTISFLQQISSLNRLDEIDFDRYFTRNES